MKSSKSHVPAHKTSENEQPSSPVSPSMLNENKPNGAHQRSHAAHLNSAGEPHTTIDRNLHKGTIPMGRKQP